MEREREKKEPGRGAPKNYANRFIETRMEYEDGERDPSNLTEVFADKTVSIIAENDSPDVPFQYSVNPYRGCEHGCIYCYARPTHEYLGLSLGLDFEKKIYAKYEAATLLRTALLKPSWKGDSVTLSGVTDPYQPVERDLQITRACLSVLREFRNPVAIISKNSLVERDIDLLKDLAKFQAAQVYITITTLDNELARKLEPRAATPKRRLETVRALADAEIPVGVMVAPLIPGLTEHEVPAILRAAHEAGAATAGYTMLRLPYGVKELFVDWLTEHFPDRKDKVLHRLTELRGGKLNNSDFSQRMRGAGIWAEQISKLFKLSSERFGLGKRYPPLSSDFFRRGETSDGQLLFDL